MLQRPFRHILAHGKEKAVPQGMSQRVAVRLLEDAARCASELPLLYLPGVPARLADADRGINRFRLVRSLGFLPDEIRHAKCHDGRGTSGGIVHMSAKAYAFLARLLSLFDKLNLDIFASTIRALHNRPFSC